jgi:hypothetical protein
MVRVVEEDHDAEQDRHEARLAPGADPADRPAGERRQPAGHVDEGGQHAEQEHERADVHLLGDLSLVEDQAPGDVADERERPPDVPVAVEQGAQDDPRPQGEKDPPRGNR